MPSQSHHNSSVIKINKYAERIWRNYELNEYYKIENAGIIEEFWIVFQFMILIGNQ